VGNLSIGLSWPRKGRRKAGIPIRVPENGLLRGTRTKKKPEGFRLPVTMEARRGKGTGRNGREGGWR